MRSASGARSRGPECLMIDRAVLAKVTAAIGITSLCILQSFLIGALAHPIQEDFPLDDALVGAGFSAYWLIAALTAVPCSRLVIRWGAARSLMVAGVSAGLASMVIPLIASNGVVFVSLVAGTGVTTALATPAMNVVIMSVVNPSRQAFALTAAGASPVFSLMAAGAATGVIGADGAWRLAYMSSGAVAILIALAIGMMRESFVDRAPAPAPAGSASERHSMRPLVLLMLGVAFGNAAIGAATAFLVVTAPSAGVSAASAGVIVALGSGVSIVVRLIVASVVDRAGKDSMPLSAALMLCGTIGFGALGVATLGTGSPVAYYVGALIVLVVSWPWVSLLLHGVLTRYRSDVAAASGIVQTVFFIGGVLGPGLMGLALTVGSVPMAWWCLAVSSGIAATVVALSRKRLPEFVAR